MTTPMTTSSSLLCSIINHFTENTLTRGWYRESSVESVRLPRLEEARKCRIQHRKEVHCSINTLQHSQRKGPSSDSTTVPPFVMKLLFRKALHPCFGVIQGKIRGENGVDRILSRRGGAAGRLQVEGLHILARWRDCEHKVY